MMISKILLVDDSESDQFLNKYLLEQYNPDIIVLSAYDGQEALKILREQEERPDAIFLDINMPGMDGHEFLIAYQETMEIPPVVAMLTSSIHSRDQNHISDFECVKCYFQKPLKREHLDKLSMVLMS